MKLEDQVVSLELAKKLKELGFKQISLWWWSINRGASNPQDPAYGHYDEWELIVDKGLNGGWHDAFISAYSVAELGEMLPSQAGEDLFIRFGKDMIGSRWDVLYQTTEGDLKLETYDLNEANARAKMLIYLKEHNV